MEKIRVTVVIEYAPNLEDYPDISTIQEAAEYDERENHFTEYPDAYLYDPADKVDVSYEVVTA
ncbi:hypothetical protein ABZ916_25555 [Streptomyces sp. NPDC046853]|uniref:hypothetical protein n=1 Tax=Streptomyces sp. NPDC046853 TaxID=3154920 RepID=UPI0033DAC156